MSRLYRQQMAALALENRRYGDHLVRIEVPIMMRAGGVVEVWRSARFLVQVYVPEQGAQRLSVNRTALDTGTGKWLDGISWDELQSIKTQTGRAHLMAVEIYPDDRDVVNVANMRHLWVLSDPLPFAWRKLR